MRNLSFEFLQPPQMHYKKAEMVKDIWRPPKKLGQIVDMLLNNSYLRIFHA